MRKTALALLILLVAAAVVASQDSSVYVRTIYVERVYPSRYGYKIEYRRMSSSRLAESYLPITWFGGAGSSARIVYAEDNSVPFMNVYWKDGEFSHLVLYVHRNVSHLSWGRLMTENDLERRFALDEPDLQY